MLLTLAAGFWEGPPAVVFRVFSDKDPAVLTAANYLPAPWCYLPAVAAAAVAVVLIAALENRRQRVKRDRVPAEERDCLGVLVHQVEPVVLVPGHERADEARPVAYPAAVLLEVESDPLPVISAHPGTAAGRVRARPGTAASTGRGTAGCE